MLTAKPWQHSLKQIKSWIYFDQNNLFYLNPFTIMSTTIQYKTLTIIQKPFRNTETFSKAESVYTPNLFDEHLVNLVKPSVSLVEIEQTIFEEKIINSFKSDKPLYSFVWFLN